jgi:hypothetical protein
VANIGYTIVALLAVLGTTFWARRNQRKSCERLARHIMKLRALALRESPSLPLDSRDPRDADARRRFDEMAHDLEGNGLQLLGEMMEQGLDGKIAGVVRWFRSQDGTTCGWCGVLQANEPAMLMFSEADGGDFVITVRGPLGMQRGLVRSPSVHHTWARWEEGLAGQVQRHRDHMARDAPAGSWRRCETMDDAMALRRRAGEATTIWRKTQPEADLLDQDLHSVLGDRYPRYAAGIRKALSSGAVERGLSPNVLLPRGAMSTHPHQLGIPPGPLTDAGAAELARIWSSGGHQYFVLDVATFREHPAVWGICALDLMKHAARAYAQLDGRSKEDAYREILGGFAAEMQHPTEPL